MGFNKDQIIVLPIGVTGIPGKFEAFKQELIRYPDVQSVTASQNVPGSGSMGFNILPEGKPNNENWQAEIYPVDYDFLSTYEMKMAEGRYFSKEFSTDAGEAVIINQTLQKSLGWKNPSGKGLDIDGETKNARVIGVIEDFNIASLHQPVSPIVMYIDPDRMKNISVRVSGQNIPATINFLEEKWQEFENQYPFEYYFLDKEFARMYQSDEQMMRTMGLFAAVAIIVACLGLFGLAAFAAEKRTKEIGIRKVMGASVSGIVTLLSKDFLSLVILANVIAWPIAWYFMNQWLENFAYRTQIGIWIFLGSALAALLIALLTVSFQAIKAATTNPIESLRYE